MIKWPFVLRSKIRKENADEVAKAEQRKDLEYKKEIDRITRQNELDKSAIIQKYESQIAADAVRYKSKLESIEFESNNKLKALEKENEKLNDFVIRLQGSYAEYTCKLASNEKQRNEYTALKADILQNVSDLTGRFHDFVANLSGKIDSLENQINLDRKQEEKSIAEMKKILRI